MNELAVSVVVAVFNRENLLDYCIDSLVYQTLESIEIILVDDHSTDHSWEIMNQWKDRFPDKIRIMKSEAKGVAHAKNTGIAAARGKYVAFVDSDDWIDYKAFSLLYDTAEQNDSQLVVSSIFKISGSSSKKICILPRKEQSYSITDFLDTANMWYLHGKLIRRDLFQRFGLLPALKRGEDLSWLFPVFSHLDHIEYLRRTFYYYEIQEDSICASVQDGSIVDDIIRGSDLLIQNTNPQYADRALAFSITRMHNLKKVYPAYVNRFDEWILTHRAKAEELLEKNPSSPLHTSVDIYSKLLPLQSALIPQRIYINGFRHHADKASYATALYGPTEFIVLDETCCCISQSPAIVQQAFDNGNMEFVGKYFAVKACYEQGGLFIDESIDIKSSFNALLSNPAFFGYESYNSFTDRVFGCCPQNPVFKTLLKTYEITDLYDKPFATLANRIKTVLIGMGNVPLKSQLVNMRHCGFSVYPVTTFVYSPPHFGSESVSQYKNEVLRQSDTVAVPQPILEALLSRQQENYEQLQRKTNKLIKERDWLQKKMERLAKDRDWLQKKTERLTKDRDWLQKKAERLTNELAHYQNSFLVRGVWAAHRLLRKFKNLLKSKSTM